MSIIYRVRHEDEQVFQEMMRKTGTEDPSLFIDQALKVFEWAIKEVNKGNLIATVDEQRDEYQKIVISSLEHVEATRRKSCLH